MRKRTFSATLFAFLLTSGICMVSGNLDLHLHPKKKRTFNKELTQLLQFFNDHAYQQKEGVYLSEIDNTGNPVSNKVFTVSLSRLIYGLSYSSSLDATYLEKAQRSSDFLLEHLTSKDSNGLFFKSFYDIGLNITDSSEILDIWQQSYGLCGLVESYRNHPNEKLLSVIRQLHSAFISRFHDNINGGFWGNINLNKGGVSGSKSLQSLMYPITAYMGNLWLADTANRGNYELFIKENLRIAYNNAWNNDLGWVNLKFDDAWMPCEHQSSENTCFTVTPGHNFQFASLLLRAKDWPFLTGAERKRYKAMGLGIIANTLNKPIYPGKNLTQGFYSQVNPMTNLVVDDRKTWWQHCEALIAFSLAEPKYKKELGELEKFYFSNFPDKTYGADFFYLNKSNSPITGELKGSMGKSAYHSVEMIRYLTEIK